jgi:hypothetical protein
MRAFVRGLAAIESSSTRHSLHERKRLVARARLHVALAAALKPRMLELPIGGEMC